MKRCQRQRLLSSSSSCIQLVLLLLLVSVVSLIGGLLVLLGCRFCSCWSWSLSWSSAQHWLAQQQQQQRVLVSLGHSFKHNNNNNKNMSRVAAKKDLDDYDSNSAFVRRFHEGDDDYHDNYLYDYIYWQQHQHDNQDQQDQQEPMVNVHEFYGNYRSNTSRCNGHSHSNVALSHRRQLGVKVTIGSKQQQSPPPPPPPIKIPLPILVASLYKSGTTSIHDYFTCGHQRSVHYRGANYGRIAVCIHRNFYSTTNKSLFDDCGPYDIWSDNANLRSDGFNELDPPND